MGYKLYKTWHENTNLFDLEGPEYILCKVTQNAHLIATTFLQKKTYERTPLRILCYVIATAKNIGDEIFSRPASFRRPFI